jgi:hypothetical protein
MSQSVNGTGNQGGYLSITVPSATPWAPGTPVGGQPSNEEVVVHQSPQHEWSPAVAAALDAERKRLGVIRTAIGSRKR